MTNERLEMAEKRLKAYYEAEIAVLTGQEYQLGSRKLKRADIGEIRQAIKELENQVEQLKGVSSGTGARRSYRVTPRDL